MSIRRCIVVPNQKRYSLLATMPVVVVVFYNYWKTVWEIFIEKNSSKAPLCSSPSLFNGLGVCEEQGGDRGCLRGPLWSKQNNAAAENGRYFNNILRVAPEQPRSLPKIGKMRKANFLQDRSSYEQNDIYHWSGYSVGRLFFWRGPWADAIKTFLYRPF